MPSTRQLRQYTVKTTQGQQITIQRRCRGLGKCVQKQLDTMLYDEEKKRFIPPKPNPDKKKKRADAKTAQA